MQVLSRPKSPSPVHWLAISAIVSVGGILILSDLIFWHRDPQGAIAVFLLPIFQFAAIAVLVNLSKRRLAKSSL
jgi:membrane protein implicated in regulation of membrane protease activity